MYKKKIKKCAVKNPLFNFRVVKNLSLIIFKKIDIKLKVDSETECSRRKKVCRLNILLLRVSLIQVDICD